MTKVFTHNFPFVRALLETRRSISHRLTFIVYLETIHDFCILAEHLGHKGSNKNHEKHLDTYFNRPSLRSSELTKLVSLLKVQIFQLFVYNH